MASTKYRTAPLPSTRMPAGIPYIIGNEAAERFSFYGMMAILEVFMTEQLRNSAGQLDVMDASTAAKWYHLFVSACYFLPVLGALLADVFLGKYRTIIALSIVYCFGHFALAIDDTRLGLAIGLGLIALGAGGIKPCVSANVGDQFGKSNQDLLPRVFSWFYFSINLGAFAATLVISGLYRTYGPQVAFAVPGVFMLLATIVFWMGRHQFVHVPPGGWRQVKDMFSGEGVRQLPKLVVIFLFVGMFWAIFHQIGSTWVDQAKRMDRTMFTWQQTDGTLAAWKLQPEQIQAANPALIMLLIPLFSYVIYPALNRVFPLTPLRKISLGFFVTCAAFMVPAGIEHALSAGMSVHIVWQLLAYLILTCAEVMVSITSLEFSYTQAPKKLKSVVMAISLLSVSVGNLFTALVNHFNVNEDKTTKLTGANYYGFFAIAMLVTAVAFIGVARRYRPQTYVQDEAAAT